MGEYYLGDGLYASFDGYQIKLRAPREEDDHEVFLEPSTYAALAAFADKCWPPKPKTEAKDG